MQKALIRRFNLWQPEAVVLWMNKLIGRVYAEGWTVTGIRHFVIMENQLEWNGDGVDALCVICVVEMVKDISQEVINDI